MPDMPVEIVEYDPNWHELFTEQRDRLAALLRPWLAACPEHVGSTAVPGLAAKPIIDILAPVRSLCDAQRATEPLEDDGWLHWADDPSRSWRLWFLRPRPEARTHHLYLIENDDLHAGRIRAFRDCLRADDALRDEYEKLKRRLAENYRRDRDAYTYAKADFVERVLRSAGG
jgi:GrpB-like predicted nucleotidyltransferase (UPF0157 family)